MRFLLDEMFPEAAATMLRDEHGHDALHVGDVGPHGTDDLAVATFARSEHRAVVTENVADDATAPDLALVCVLKREQASSGGQHCPT